MKTILVTGANGFLGRHLCRRLIHDGHTVVGIDDMSTSKDDWTLPHASPRMTLKVGDIRNLSKLDSYLNFDEIYHLACPASPPHYQARPLHTFWTAVSGTNEVLNLAGACEAKLVIASTSEIYGDPLEHPQAERYWGHVNSVGPRSIYDEGKRAAETLCYEHHKLGVDVRVARIFNTYGPGMDLSDGRMVPNFITQALAGEELTIYGDGMQTRSLCYVDDLIEGLHTLMDRDMAGGLPVFNLGSPDEATVLEVAALVTELVGRGSFAPNMWPMPVDDPTMRRPNIDRAVQMLGWTPAVALHDGMLSTIENFKARMEAEAAEGTAQ